MAAVRRPHVRAAARTTARSAALRLGAELKTSRARRGLSQDQLGALVGLHPSRIGQLERGAGSGAPLELWFALADVLARPFLVKFDRDRFEEPADAGHLAVQELVLRLGRGLGFPGRFELATRPADPSRSADVGLSDRARRRLWLVECWNTVGDVGAARRATSRKIAEAEALAVALGGEAGALEVRACWVVRATARNRELLGRYPEVFRTACPGSSRGWVAALTRGLDPPADLGLVLCDPGATRVFEWRPRA